jgi:hypothetical protein
MAIRNKKVFDLRSARGMAVRKMTTMPQKKTVPLYTCHRCATSRVFVRVATAAAVNAVKPAKICTRRSILDGAIVCSASAYQRSQVAMMTETLYP